MKRLKVLLCYDFQNDNTYEKKDVMFIVEPKLFSIGTISLHGGLFFSFTLNIIVGELTT